MEVIEVVGMRDVNFTDDNGRKVEGTSVFYLIQADGVVGKMAGKLFVSKDRRSGMDYFPAVGEKVAVNYDRYGKPSQFKPIK
ncbi:MAG: hypothetical protein SO072_10955 [Dysosmobacter sp.]|nr:hypothetical protein [Dysosmobacter sp.]